MKKRIGSLVLLDLAFLLLLSVSGLASGALRWLLYALAYILPIAVSFFMIRRLGLLAEPPRVICKPKKKLFVSVLFAPAMLAIVGISALTSLLLSLFGITNMTDVSGNLFYELFRHALLPAVLEELLFRYVPIKLLLPHSRRGAILISATLFSLIHLNLFQIPYALFAGVVLAFITVVSESMIPAVLLHFFNNTVSVIWMRNPDISPYIILVSLSVVTLLSAVYIIKKRGEYRTEIISSFSGESGVFSLELAVMVAVCLIISVISL